MVSVEKICYDSNQTTITFNRNNNCSYPSVTNYVQCNQCNNEWDWWCLKVSPSKIYYDFNQMKITFNWKTTAFTFLLPMLFGGSNVTINERDEFLRWVHHEYVMIRIIQNIIQSEKTNALTFLLLIMFNLIDGTFHDIDAVWRLVHQKLKWVESYVNWIQLGKQINLPCYSQLSSL